VRHSHALTSAAVHPLGTCVATGDVTGRITLWYELDSALAKAAAAGTDELVGGGYVSKRGPRLRTSLLILFGFLNTPKTVKKIPEILHPFESEIPK
jgi:hypothetical protein